MNVYRIVKSRFKNDLSGEGARLHGGRWNRPGLAVLYTSEARSLALLELIVHFNAKAAIALDYFYMTISIDPERIVTVDKTLLKGLKTNINNDSYWKITEDYFINKNAMALRVPSVLVPNEYNILLNPSHASYYTVELIGSEETHLDERFNNLWID